VRSVSRLNCARIRSPHPKIPPPSSGADCFSFQQASDGALYGAGKSIFKIDPNGGNFTVLHYFTDVADGTLFYGTLLQASDGALYGAGMQGGTNNNGGTLFTINTNGTGFKVLHTFGNTDGFNPLGALITGN